MFSQVKQEITAVSKKMTYVSSEVGEVFIW